jgi:hypothetical protein
MKGKKTKKEVAAFNRRTTVFDRRVKRISARRGGINPFFLSAHRLEFTQALPVRLN